jgi:hypothetical protein
MKEYGVIGPRISFALFLDAYSPTRTVAQPGFAPRICRLIFVTVPRRLFIPALQ